MAADYIRREEALEITTRTCGDYAAAWAEIRKLPAADVVPVVRCKDCRYHEYNNKNKIYCYHCFGLDDVEPDYYCCHGERKE